MPRPKLELAGIFRTHGPAYRRANAGHLNLAQLKAMSAIEACRTGALGGHVAACAEDLLPVEYFHVVFTLPAGMARIALWNKRALYSLLFKASAQTVMTIAADPKRPGARAGLTSVLHTSHQRCVS